MLIREMRRTAIALLAACALLLALANSAQASGLCDRMTGWLHQGGGASSGLLVVEAGSGDVVCSEDAQRARPLASNMKLFTTATALSRFGSDHRIPTTLVRDGRIDSRGVLHGSLYLVGGGDPALGVPAFYNRYHGGLGTNLLLLKRQVREAGIKRVTGRLYADDTIFDRLRGVAYSNYGLTGEIGPLSGLDFDSGYTTPSATAFASDPAKVAAAMQGNATIAARYSTSSSGAVLTMTYLATIDDTSAATLSINNDTSVGITPVTSNTITGPAGTVSTLAGSAGISGVFDGSGTFALFNQPKALAVDSLGNVYVADTGNSSIRLVTARGTVSTLAGISGISGYRNGSGANALFNMPEGLFLDSALRVVDTGNSRIRAVSLATAQVSNIALTAPSSTSTSTTTTTSTSSGGGGGAPSIWFLAALGALAAGRYLKRRQALAQDAA